MFQLIVTLRVRYRVADVRTDHAPVDHLGDYNTIRITNQTTAAFAIVLRLVAQQIAVQLLIVVQRGGQILFDLVQIQGRRIVQIVVLIAGVVADVRRNHHIVRAVLVVVLVRRAIGVVVLIEGQARAQYVAQIEAAQIAEVIEVGKAG